MAYIKDKDFIFTKMHSNRLSYYKVLDSDGKTILDQQDDDEVSVDEAVNLLRDTLENISGLITIVLSEKSTRAKAAGGKIGDIRYTIKITDDTKGINGHEEVRNDTLRHAIAAQYEAKMETLVEKHKNEIALMKIQADHDRKFNELNEKIKELKEGDMTEKVMPYLAGIFGNMVPGAGAAINGIPQEPHLNGPGDDFKLRLTSAINRIIKVDSNFVDNLEKLADLAESKPFIYKVAIEKLNSL
jgi:hypothetical protein